MHDVELFIFNDIQTCHFVINCYIITINALPTFVITKMASKMPEKYPNKNYSKGHMNNFFGRKHGMFIPSLYQKHQACTTVVYGG